MDIIEVSKSTYSKALINKSSQQILIFRIVLLCRISFALLFSTVEEEFCDHFDLCLVFLVFDYQSLAFLSQNAVSFLTAHFAFKHLFKFFSWSFDWALAEAKPLLRSRLLLHPSSWNLQTAQVRYVKTIQVHVNCQILDQNLGEFTFLCISHV